MANIFLGIYYNLAVWFKVTDQTHYGAKISILGSCITLLGNFFMIPILGYLGSALATLSCYASMTIICYLLGRKHYPIPYEVGSALFYLSLTGIIAWLSLQISISNQVFEFFIQNSLLIVFLGTKF